MLRSIANDFLTQFGHNDGNVGTRRAALWVGKAKSSYAARRVPTSANIFLITEAVFCKFNLPTSRFARKHLATKGFGAGGVAPTPPVNLPSEPRP